MALPRLSRSAHRHGRQGYIPFPVVFPKDGFAKAKAVENKEELPVVYVQQSGTGTLICGRSASRLTKAKAPHGLRLGGSDEEGRQTVLDIISDHSESTVFGVEPSALLGKPLCRPWNVE